MKQNFLNVRALLLTFAFGVASVNFFQSFSDASETALSESQRIKTVPAVMIVPVDEKVTQSRMVENSADAYCNCVPADNFDASSKKNKNSRLIRKSLND